MAFKIALSLLLLAAITVNLSACVPSVQAADLMTGISGKSVQGKDADAKFIGNTADFSLALFKKASSEEKNSLISPLSVLLALAMTANGADTQTLSEMEAVLGGDIGLDALNEYLYSYVTNLPKDKKARVDIANSIWFQEDEDQLLVEKDFLQKNADYYNAAAYKSPFDGQTLRDINNWVKENTDGMIDKILDQISPAAVMYLINAVVFDAQWDTVYKKNNIHQGEFTNLDGTKQTAEFMHSEESIYLDDGRATGFIKPYADNKYSFVALLPNEGITVGDYIQGLTGEGFLQTIDGAVNTAVSAALPKFSYDYTIQMNAALLSLGMPTAFSPETADFSKLGKSARGNIYIGEVLHKTFIQVDELGTKAGAVTKVEMKCGSVMEAKVVRLDRPFVYAIIDNASKLPVFIGAVMEIAD
ncbi:MAG: serpin family protein [Eubacteriales bacterium]|nr:serpin family protein [Eubacteriales bacterium]MDD4769004.1 serpin family protein [Eubacteriales bacterium]